ncbi:MAG: BamA/TamA family outer membrane protein [Oscillatoriales cyanobacterium C42_A2020_001]|nr:BamA/TamA family outer membrane protein [Leptolyngbyaceae cyanobacterium C42_A2020_001]
MNAPTSLAQNATRLYLSLLAASVLATIATCTVEGAIAQEYSTTTAAASTISPVDPRYYQEYQSVIVPTEPIDPPTAQFVPPPSQIPPPPSPSPIPAPPPVTPAPNPGAGSPPVVVPSPGPGTPVPPATLPSSLNEPIWVVPATPPTTAQPVTVPPSTVPPRQPAPSPRSPAPGELVVQATDVQIIGVEPETQAYGLDIIQTKPGGQTSPTLLQNDIAILENSGFFSNVTVSTRQNPQGLSVTFSANPVTLQALQLSNAQGLSLSVANSIFKDQFGQPITPGSLNQAVKQINDWYAQNGFTLARVVSLQPTPQGIVVVEVAEGRIADVKIRFVNREGQSVDANGKPIRYRTQDAFVRRQIKLQPGQAFQVETAREDLARLQALGIFEQTNVTFEGDARNTVVVYNLQERPPRDLRFGGGYNDTLGLFGTVNIQDVNFGGLGQQLGGTVLVGTRDVQFDARFVSPYRDTEPNVPGYSANAFRNQGLSNVFTDEVRLPNDDRVRERRYGASVGLEQPLGDAWKGSWGLNYTNVSIRDSGGRVFARDELGNPLSLSDSGIDDLFNFSFTALRDLRDNTVNPRTGSLVRLNTEQYFPIGRGNVLGTKLQANYTQFIPITLITASHKTPPNPAESQPETLAFNVQGGTWVGDLPPYNAFVLGGPFSVRGWDTGAIATSRSYVEASAEYRFPIYRFIGGAAFIDFASDLGSSDDVPGKPGVIRDKPGTGLGFGFGVRVNSPLGILRGDLGISNQGDVRFQFGFGQRF